MTKELHLIEGKKSKIEITNLYIENSNQSPIFQNLVKKSFPVKTSYWLSKAFEHLRRESKIYFEEKKKLIEKHALRHTQEGEEKDGKGKVIRRWKEGDVQADASGNVTITDVEEFQKGIRELQEIKITLGVNRIKLDLDKAPDLTVEEMTFLLPLIEEIGE